MDKTTSEDEPPGLTERTSTQARRSRSTVALDRMQSTTTTAREAHQHQAAQDTAHEQQSNLKRQQTEKKAEDRFYVDNDYYSLNPWYERDPPKPLFGLGRPFPRTVRPGMLWGRKDVGDEDEQNKQHGNHPDFTTLQIAPRINEHGEQQPPPDRFEAELDGRRYLVTRIEDPNSEHEVGCEDQYHEESSKEETYRSFQSPALRPDSVGNNSHGDPFDDAKSTAETAQTAETQAEKQEILSREAQAVQDYYNSHRNPISRLRARYPEALAEFLSTTVYIFFGLGGSLYSITYPVAEGDYITQSWAWGFAVMAGIYVGGGVSGSHMNPWVSIAFSIYRGFPWKLSLVYCCMQILAGFAAGALAWFTYRDAIMYLDPQLTPSITGKALYTIPNSHVSTGIAFFNDFLSAALYTCVAFGIGDDSNTPPGSGMSALIYGLMSFLLCITFGYNGLGVSPARDLSPRSIAWWVGYGTGTFSTGWWAYGPIGAGLSGVLTGALVYDLFIFAGGESPVNYNWPSAKELRDRVRSKKRNVQEGDRGVEV